MKYPGECKLCGARLILPAGDPHSPWLIASEFPSWEEFRAGRPFAGPAGEVLRHELSRVGLHYADFRVTNLWLHEPPERGRTNASKADWLQERDWHLEFLQDEMEHRQAILLLGSSVVEAVLGYPVMQVAGLSVKALPRRGCLVPPTTDLAMCAPNPAIVYQKGQTAGEFTLALDKFAAALSALTQKGKRQ